MMSSLFHVAFDSPSDSSFAAKAFPVDEVVTASVLRSVLPERCRTCPSALRHWATYMAPLGGGELEIGETALHLRALSHEGHDPKICRVID